MLPSVSVIVPTFRRPDALPRTLRALAASDYPAELLEVIVVDDDNGRSPAVAQATEGLAIAVRAVSQPNLGAAAARNRGARASAGELLLFCDDDILVEPAGIGDHVALHERRRRCLVNGVWQFSHEARARLEATPFGRYRLALEERFQDEARRSYERLADEEAECYLAQRLSACNLSVRRQLYWEIGGFDEAFPYAGAEDQDLSLRARRAGCDLVVCPHIRLRHDDTHVTLRRFCRREELSAHTTVVLAQRHPELSLSGAAGRAVSAGPAYSRRRLAVMTLLAAEPLLALLHAAGGFSERLPIPASVRRRVYDLLISVHLFRGRRSQRRRPAAVTEAAPGRA